MAIICPRFSEPALSIFEARDIHGAWEIAGHDWRLNIYSPRRGLHMQIARATLFFSLIAIATPAGAREPLAGRIAHTIPPNSGIILPFTTDPARSITWHSSISTPSIQTFSFCIAE